MPLGSPARGLSRAAVIHVSTYIRVRRATQREIERR